MAPWSRVGIASRLRGERAGQFGSPGARYLHGQTGVIAAASALRPGCELRAGGSGPRRLALVPMIAGRDALLFSFERPDVCYIGHPLPQPRPGARATADSALATILGPVRAAILQALRQSLTVSDLAAAAPITREKSGPSVWISRTSRGDELVNLRSD